MYLLFLMYVLLFAKKIGSDEFGNKYYEKKDILANRKRRFVIYKGMPEASKIPDVWEFWLRHTINIPTPHNNLHWQKSHLPNLSGTNNQYNPTIYNNINSSYNDYKPWRP